MNAQEIRKLAIERMAKAYSCTVPEAWEKSSDAFRDAARRHVTPFVDALGDLLPTTSRDELCGGFQWGIGYTIDEYPPTFTTREYSGSASLDDDADYQAYVQWHRDRGRPTPVELQQAAAAEEKQ